MEGLIVLSVGEGENMPSYKVGMRGGERWRLDIS